MAKQSSGTGTIVMLALAGILGVAAYAGNEWLKYQRADYSVLPALPIWKAKAR